MKKNKRKLTQYCTAGGEELNEYCIMEISTQTVIISVKTSIHKGVRRNRLQRYAGNESLDRIIYLRPSSRKLRTKLRFQSELIVNVLIFNIFIILFIYCSFTRLVTVDGFKR